MVKYITIIDKFVFVYACFSIYMCVSVCVCVYVCMLVQVLLET